MRTEIEDYTTIAKKLKGEFPKLSDFEILTLAIQIERNQILENGLVVSTTDSNPSGLEALAIAIGYAGRYSSTNIISVLQELADKE
ncbi:histidine kinase [Myroides fluvii]|uniref:histidine kinase n=1 Tax=Myroides fluvii TaxID=2572594 RepID=UPI00131DFA8C|nr:histidine kinase [Myroides fluvii]